jgi:hypothetical protein
MVKYLVVASVSAILLASFLMAPAKAGQAWQGMFAPCRAAQYATVDGALDASPCGLAAPAVVTPGWQPEFTYSVPAGTVSLFFHFSCPSSFPVVWNGAFAFSAANGNQTQQVYLQYNGPRLDENPVNYGEWGWHFYWPSGSPNPTQITFAPFCQKVQ